MPFSNDETLIVWRPCTLDSVILVRPFPSVICTSTGESAAHNKYVINGIRIKFNCYISRDEERNRLRV